MKRKRKKLRTVKANIMMLEDLEGRTRMIMDATNPDRGVSLTMFSKDCASICLEISDNNHAVVSIGHPDGRTSACIALKADGSSGLELWDAKGLPSIRVDSGNDKIPPSIRFQARKTAKPLAHSKKGHQG